MIAVVDYGIGNLRSAEKALQHLGADARLTADAGAIARGRRGRAARRRRTSARACRRCATRGLEAVTQGGRDRRPAVPRHLRRHADAVRRQRRVARCRRASASCPAASPGCPTRCGSRRWAGTRSTIAPASRLVAGPARSARGLLRALVRARARRRRASSPRGATTAAGSRPRSSAARCGRRSSTPRRAAPSACALLGNFVDAVAAVPHDGPVSRRSTCATGRSCGCSRATTTPRRSTTTIRSRSRARFDAAGARWIHVVDLDAARRRRRRRTWRRSKRSARTCRRACRPAAACARVDDASERFAAGVRARRVGSAAVEHPELVDELARAASRARSRSGSTRAAATSRSTAGPTSTGLDLVDARAALRPIPGVGALVVTDIGRDGMLGGPDARAARAPCSPRSTMPVIASGGVASARRPARARRARRRRPAARGRDRRARDLRRPLHRRGGDRRVLAVRVIPCLDVDAGRVVKGVQLRRHPRRRRSRSSSRRATTPKAPTSSCSSTSPRRPTTATRWCTSSSASPSRCSSRSPSAAGSAASKTCAACCAPAPTRSRSTPRRSNDPEHRAARRRRVRRAVHRRRDRRPPAQRRRPGAGWEVVTHGGRTPTGLDAVEWAEQVVRARRGRDPAHVDGPRRHQGRLRHRAAAGDGRRGRRAGDRERRRRHARAPLRGRRRRAAPSAVLAASIFHFGQHTVREAKALPRRRRGLTVAARRSTRDPKSRARNRQVVPRGAGLGYRDRTECRARRPARSEEVPMPETHDSGGRATVRVDDHFFRRYRALLDAEDCAFDELEHAYEDGDRAAFETRSRRLADRRSSAARRSSSVNGLSAAPLVASSALSATAQRTARSRPTSVSSTTRSVRPTKKWLAPATTSIVRVASTPRPRPRPRRARGTRRARASTRCFGRGSSPTAS